MWFNNLVNYNPVTKIIEGILKSSKLLSDFVDYFANLFCKNCPNNIGNILFGLGVTSVTFSTLAFFFRFYQNWKWIPSHFANRKTVNKQDLTKRYGKGYVVITGCTDGIGLAFAQILAPMFDLILVARNKQKLDMRIKVLKEVNPSTQIIPVIGDLSKEDDIRFVVQSLKQLTERNIQINMVINNAGTSSQGPFLTRQPKVLHEVSMCNGVAVYEINKFIVPYFKRRNQRSALINVTSCTGVYWTDGAANYPSIKHLIDLYTRTMALENSQKIDFLTSRPFGVQTSMLKMRKGMVIITPHDCAFSTLADLGKTVQTYSGFKHKITATFFEQKPLTKRFQLYKRKWTMADLMF